MTRISKTLFIIFLMLAGCNPDSSDSGSNPSQNSEPPSTQPPTSPEPPSSEPSKPSEPPATPVPPVTQEPPKVPSEPVFAIDLACTNRVTGSWNFGAAPYACNVSPSISQAWTKIQYSPVLFDHSGSSTTVRNGYMTQMYALLRETGTYYLRRRNPQVSATEVAAFLEGLYALAHQETFWTHYRKPTDGIIRYMRGDFEHGHGMMQVDDRSHVAALMAGKGVDLGYNITYGLDIYYAAWVKTPTQSCVGSATNYVARARAAWSAYNGGPSRICRFYSSPTTGDSSYYTKLQQKLWLRYVTSKSASTPFNIRCLVEGSRPCLLAEGSLP
jgi:hypothetical protein